jgi:hypothetical protein
MMRASYLTITFGLNVGMCERSALCAAQGDVTLTACTPHWECGAGAITDTNEMPAEYASQKPFVNVSHSESAIT